MVYPESANSMLLSQKVKEIVDPSKKERKKERKKELFSYILNLSWRRTKSEKTWFCNQREILDMLE